MMSTSLRVAPTILACPACSSDLELENGIGLQCLGCALNYPVVDGRSILLHPSNKLFRAEYYVAAQPKPYVRSRWAQYLPTVTADLAATRVLTAMREQLDVRGTCKVLVVGGGCQREWLDVRLRKSFQHAIIYTDVDVSADVDLFCDGHDLPFKNEIFDAVVITAVLEHVLYPERVVAEIWRVLKPTGLVYSEVPFIQQVHEGAYDFTRYTLSGHRRLFNHFSEMEAGMTAGPGSALAWSIESFVLAFVRARHLRLALTGACRILCAPLKYFDKFLSERSAAMDGACGTYFFGRKSSEVRSDSDIVSAYIGAKQLFHT